MDETLFVVEKDKKRKGSLVVLSVMLQVVLTTDQRYGRNNFSS